MPRLFVLKKEDTNYITRRIGIFIFLMGLTHMVAHCVNFLRLSQATDVNRVNEAFGFHYTYIFFNIFFIIQKKKSTMFF
jgi:hypothetical protein